MHLWLRSVESLFASGLQRLSGALLLRLIDWRLVILGVFGYVGGSHIFASRRIRPRIVTPPGFISLHSQVCFISVRVLYLSLSLSPFSPSLPTLSFCFSFLCLRRLHLVEVVLHDSLQIRLNFRIRGRVSLTIADCVLHTLGCLLGWSETLLPSIDWKGFGARNYVPVRSDSSMSRRWGSVALYR